MNNLLFLTAAALGAFAICAMGYDFASANTLAFVVTASIGGVYLIGIIELLRFRHATASLGNALGTITPQMTAAPDWFENWLQQLDPAVRSGVRMRILGERSGLPTPVFTPYLVGLLVMLGLLGTFIGMVDTLGGAVSALQGSTELDAIRASLTAPMQGLGVAFGTSVAGVAASAMLGLISTLARHERIRVTRQLDTGIATVFNELTPGHQRQRAYDALHSQAGALPAVASDLQAVTAQLAQMGDKLAETLLANQSLFHTTTETRFSELATSVEKSLRESLTASGKAAGDSMQPVMTTAVADIRTMLQETQQQQAVAAGDHLQAIGREFSAASTSVLQEFASTSSAWAEQTKTLQDTIRNTLTESARELSDTTRNTATSMLVEIGGLLQSSEALVDARTAAEAQWLDSQGERMEQLTQIMTTAVADISAMLQETQQQQAIAASDHLQNLGREFGAASTSVLDGFATTSSAWTEQAQALQDTIRTTLTESANELSDNARTTATSTLAEIGRLLQSTEALVEARTATEKAWLDNQGERMEQLTQTLGSQLDSLRMQEEQRQSAAIARLAELESTVATHLVQLGQGLEAPMTRLIETASETPRAAAEVIGLLRAEITNNVERDNQLLEERLGVMQELNALSASLQEAATGQRSAVENLVETSTAMLQDITGRFGDNLVAEVAKMSEASAHVAGGAIELSSLGEAFGHAVSLFNSSNEAMMEHLARVEESMDKYSTRNDEQMAYYVAQAREIIDHSMLSQKEIMDDMRRINRKTAQLATGAQ